MHDIIYIMVIFVLVCLLVWTHWFYSRQVDNLTSKVMARDYSQYAIHNEKAQKYKEPEKKKRDVDPNMGRHF